MMGWMAVRSLGLWAGAAVVLCAANTASAYCRTHTEDPAASSCPEACPEEGLPLAWPDPKLTYAFNENGFPGLEDEDLRRIIATSIGTWENVKCDGRAVGISSTAEKDPTALALGPEKEEPNENVIVHFTSSQWNGQSLPSRAFAITAVWFNPDNGDILGADMLFNGAMDPFGECSDFGCTATDPHTDLRNVATHEFGHFLGLSHSDVDGSTMWCDADAAEVSKRSLAADDIKGLCDIYPPGEAFQELQQRTKTNHGCALEPGQRSGDLRDLPWTAFLVPLALWYRRRRRS